MQRLVAAAWLRNRLSWSFVVAVGLLCRGAPADAQSIGVGLSALLTEQTPPPAGYERDRAAAEATFATVAGLFTVELTSLPVASSSGGFVYRFNRSLGSMERASDSFGPFYSERSLRNGRDRVSVGMAYQFASFSSLQGADLEVGTFPTNTARFAGQLQPFSVDALSLTLDVDTVTMFASYGIIDRLDVGVAAPVTRLRFFGRRMNTFNGTSTLQSAQSGSATGLGDLTVNTRYLIAEAAAVELAAGADLRLPTGREEDLLGGGETALRMLGIASWERDRVGLHANGGFGFGGVTREAFWAASATYAAGLRVTLVGELMGRYLSELNRVADVYQPHPVLAGIETMRWLPTEGGTHISSLVTGVKWNPTGNWLVNAHLLTRLTETGLRARFTPAMGLDYAVSF